MEKVIKKEFKKTIENWTISKNDFKSNIELFLIGQKVMYSNFEEKTLPPTMYKNNSGFSAKLKVHTSNTISDKSKV